MYRLTKEQAAAVRRRVESGILRALCREGRLDEARMLSLLERGRQR